MYVGYPAGRAIHLAAVLRVDGSSQSQVKFLVSTQMLRLAIVKSENQLDN